MMTGGTRALPEEGFMIDHLSLANLATDVNKLTRDLTFNALVLMITLALQCDAIN